VNGVCDEKVGGCAGAGAGAGCSLGVARSLVVGKEGAVSAGARWRVGVGGVFGRAESWDLWIG